MPTLNQVIDNIDAIMPNPYTNAQKTAWINELAAQIQTDVWLIDAFSVTQFTYSDEYSPELLPVPAAYAGMWETWLKAKIHAANSENDLYANAAAMFNEEYGAFVRWFSRTYDPSDMVRNTMHAYTVSASGAGNADLILILPPRALCVNIHLNVTTPATENVFQLLAGPNNTEVGTPVFADTAGDNMLGWISAAALNGDRPTDVRLSSVGSNAVALLTMKIFVPEDVYIMMQHNKHHGPSWDPWND